MDDPWGPPQNLGLIINSGSSDHCAMVSPDGHRLLFLSDRPGGMGVNDFYISFRRDTHDDFAWETPEHVDAISSPFDEFGPTYFEDDETGTGTLYFTSNRPGGLGGYDVWASPVADNFTFGTPVLVPELSSSSQDQFPNVRHNGLELFLRSNRPGSIPSPATGLPSFDLWVSTRGSTSDPWSPPVNLGSIVNSGADEQRPSISWNGASLFFSSNRAGGAGGFDQWVTTRTKLRGHDDGQ